MTKTPKFHDLDSKLMEIIQANTHLSKSLQLVTKQPHKQVKGKLLTEVYEGSVFIISNFM